MFSLERFIQVSWPLRVFFTEDVFAPVNPLLREVLTDTAPRQVLVVLEDSLAQAHPKLVEQVVQYFAAPAGPLLLSGQPILVAGGEPLKIRPPLWKSCFSTFTVIIWTGIPICWPWAGAPCWMWPGLPPP